MKKKSKCDVVRGCKVSCHIFFSSYICALVMHKSIPETNNLISKRVLEEL